MKAAKESKASSNPPDDSNSAGKGNSIGDDFKISLAAMCSSEDYKTLEEQFFRGN